MRTEMMKPSLVGMSAALLKAAWGSTPVAAQDAGSIVGWGSRVVGVDLTHDCISVAVGVAILSS